MLTGITDKGAARLAAPFTFRLLLWCACLPVSAQSAICPADNPGERVRVSHVYDGDTVKLDDGRKLRLIGINTPEKGYRGAADQPMAEAARQALDNLLDSHDQRLQLQYGRQRHDRYGRLLAHAFMGNGENVAVHLLDKGLAITTVVPPNDWGARCYQAVEQEARKAARGLWNLPDYRSLEARLLPPETSGFHIVHGRINTVRRTRYSLWLELDGPLSVRIPVKNISTFHEYDFDSLAGSQVEVRGWIRKNGTRLNLKVQHPAALVIMTSLQTP